jgi:hypothetical protein
VPELLVERTLERVQSVMLPELSEKLPLVG